MDKADKINERIGAADRHTVQRVAVIGQTRNADANRAGRFVTRFGRQCAHALVKASKRVRQVEHGTAQPLLQQAPRHPQLVTTVIWRELR